MALADLALQMSGWNTVVTDLVDRLGVACVVVMSVKRSILML